MKDKNTALLLVDIQNDFCEGGALEVPESDAIFDTVNRWIERAQDNAWPVIASRDWHPKEHCSFEERGGPWPEHCVQDTPGATFHPRMQLPAEAVRVSKGTAFETDRYSAFDGTELDQYLKRHGIRTVVVAGLALDVCVQATVRDALEHGFEVDLLVEGTRAVDRDKGSKVLSELEEKGANLVREAA
ncbi:nicotinamidase/pyrazinamidase [Marinobacter daqiaonensis]|uniref:nicotinamidase n=1 Tax=Marinobacter daqiaonensis TaxID=650891 RepID=A0A1I6HLK2_9GAMM|nr:isochorismatase family protein [Marinobacter daqiaonensis]SFR55325.1 nicotinamidase/pyrazinamidase [Marinobacter daqiaonensis]